MEAVNHPASKSLETCTRLFLEVFEELDSGLALQHGIGIGIFCPSKRVALAKCLVTPRKSGINDILVISADSDKASVGRVGDGGRENLGAAEFARDEWEFLTVRRLVFYRNNGLESVK
jgi:hypothetical protein